MQLDEYEIVKYHIKYEKQVLEILALLWGHNPDRNAAYFNWKYYQNPYAKEPIVRLALYDGRVIGVRSFFANCWHIGKSNQKILCLQDADTVIDKEHRRRGLLKNMSLMALDELARDGYKYDFTLSGNKFSSAAVQKIGWRSTGELVQMRWQAVRTINSAFKRRSRKFTRKVPLLSKMLGRMSRDINSEGRNQEVRPHFAELDRNYKRRGRQENQNITLDKNPRPSAMVKIIQRIGNNGRIQHVRDQEFFNWRYNSPFSIYRFIFWGNPGLEGYLVLQISKDSKQNKATIVDMEATDIDTKADLLRAVIGWGDFDSLDIWSATLFKDMRVLLNELDFRSLDELKPKQDTFIQPLLVRPTQLSEKDTSWSIEGQDLLVMENWDLRAIYSDAY